MKKKRKINENFGSMIKYLRKKRGYSLQQLEDITGVSASYINRLEKNERNSPSYSVIELLCKALDVPEHEILELKNKTNKSPKFLGEIILTNDFLLDEQVANKEQKEKIVDILEEIIYNEWSEMSKIKDLLEIIELIDEFKEI